MEAPYTGPHELIELNKDSSTATIKKNNDHIIVSIQRLKPCTKSFGHGEDKPSSPAVTHSTHRSLLILPTTVQQGLAWVILTTYHSENIHYQHGVVQAAERQQLKE